MFSMKSERFKGYFFALLATISYSCVYIFSKAALNDIGSAGQLASGEAATPDPFHVLLRFIFYQFLVAFSLNLLWSGFTGKLRLFRNLSWLQFRIFLLLGFMEVLTNTSFYLSIMVISDPSVTSFLGNLYPVILTLMGVILLKERFNWIESIGVFLALTGAFVISYTGGTSWKNMFIPGTLIVLINAILASTTSVIGKVNIPKLTPDLITLNSTFWPLLTATVMMLVFREPLAISFHAFTNVAAGALLGPFLGVLLIYYSFKFIEASRSSIIQSLKGIVVLAGAWLYFKTLPAGHQVLGGLLTVAGVLIMTITQAGINRTAARNARGITPSGDS
jgi:drug/metabolite transporter (DMT)-like permease